MPLCLLITGESFEQSASENKLYAVFFIKKKKNNNNRCIGNMLLMAVERGEREMKMYKCLSKTL